MWHRDLITTFSSRRPPTDINRHGALKRKQRVAQDIDAVSQSLLSLIFQEDI